LIEPFAKAGQFFSGGRGSIRRRGWHVSICILRNRSADLGEPWRA
jgi:hypothetical protein